MKLYNVETTLAYQFRGCTGFDGGFEIRVAIRGLDPRQKSELKYKR